MKLRNIFKKKPKEKPKREKKPVEEPKEIKEKTIPPKEKRKVIGEAYRILKSPHVSEKATELAKKNQYIFKVWQKSNKNEIKKAIEGLYGIDVSSIKIVNVPRKKRRLGRVSGWRKGYKKAIVKVKEGQKIEVLPR